ncbi:MAG: proteasome subunit beta [Thermoprotei archaeon]
MNGFIPIKGTTTIGIKASDGVVLAADRRATAGYIVANKHVKKILIVTNYCAITIAGTVGEAFNLVDRLKSEAYIYELRNNSKMSVKSIANYASLFINSKKFSVLPIQVIIGGYDSSPELFMIDFFGSLSSEDYIATGSGTHAALGFVLNHLKPNLTLAEAIPIAIKGIMAAIEWDTATGEGVDVVYADKEGVKRLDDHEVAKYAIGGRT